MIRPEKYMKLEQCTLSVAAALLREIRSVPALPLGQLEDLVSARQGHAALANLQNALSLLYLIGMIDYDETADAILYLEREGGGET